MIGMDQKTLDGLRSLIKLLLELTQAERPRPVSPGQPCMPPQTVPAQPVVQVPEPEPGVSEGGNALRYAAQAIHTYGEYARDAVMKGEQLAVEILAQQAVERDAEQKAVDQVIQSLVTLKSLPSQQPYKGEKPAKPKTEPEPRAEKPSSRSSKGRLQRGR